MYEEVVASRNGGPGTDHEGPGIDSEERPTGGRPGDRRTTDAGSNTRTLDHTTSPSDVGSPEPQLPDTPAARRSAEDPPVRDPGQYAVTTHFRERMAQPGRYVSIATASEAIRCGQLRWNTTDGWRFALVEDGVRFIVVVGDTETASPVVVTAWTEIADWKTAMESSRWTASEVNTIQLRSDLSTRSDEQIPDLIRPRDIDRPFVIGNHRVHTRPGYGYVTCANCEAQFRSKEGLKTRFCQ